MPPPLPPEYHAGIRIESNGSKREVQGASGALGCFAKRNSDGRPVLLTNSHVMFPGYRVFPSTGIYQPNFSDCCSGGDHIAAPVYDTHAVPTDHADHSNPAKPKPPDWYGGYKDGKWYGGFSFIMGDTWWKSLDRWTEIRNQPCSMTDCAMATIDPGLRYKNVLRAPAPDGDIWIEGVNTNPLDILGPVAGYTPTAEQYVRVLSPRNGGTLIFATLLDHFIKGLDTMPPYVRLDENTTKRTYSDNHEYYVSPYWWNGFPPEDGIEVGTKTLWGQFMVLPRPRPIPGETDYKKFYNQPGQTLNFDFGDSGSVVIDYQGKVIAQVVFKQRFDPERMCLPRDRDKIEFTSVDWIAIATPIAEITYLLGLTISPRYSGTAPSAGSTTSVYVSGFVRDAAAIAQRDAVERLRAGLRRSRRGKLVLGKIGQHRDEVRQLLAVVREIGAAWHALNGPAFFHHCVRSANEPAHVIPTSINGVSRDQLIAGLLPLLARHGSAALRRDIDRHGRWLAGALLAVPTLVDLPAALARPGRHG